MSGLRQRHRFARAPSPQPFHADFFDIIGLGSHAALQNIHPLVADLLFQETHESIDIMRVGEHDTITEAVIDVVAVDLHGELFFRTGVRGRQEFGSCDPFSGEHALIGQSQVHILPQNVPVDFPKGIVVICADGNRRYFSAVDGVVLGCEWVVAVVSSFEHKNVLLFVCANVLCATYIL